MNFLDPATLTKWFQVVVADLVLAGDNAIVIALAVRGLPKRQQFWGRMFGTAGAVGLRIGFIAIVTVLLKIPLLQLIGGIMLFYISVKLLKPGHMVEEVVPAAGEILEGQESDHPKVRAGSTLREAIWIIVLADVVMSLDNVIAIAAVAKDDITLAVFGILLSIPLVVWGSGLISRLMATRPWLIWVAGGMLGYVAAKMIFADPWVIRMLGPQLQSFKAGSIAALGTLVGSVGYLATDLFQSAPPVRSALAPTLYYLEKIMPWVSFIALTMIGWIWARHHLATAARPRTAA